MMRILKNSALSLFVISIITATAFSLSVSASNELLENDRISLYGNTDCKKSGEVICVDVWAHDSNIEDLRKINDREKYTEFIAFRDDLLSGENGEYNITISLKNHKSGLYDAYIRCDCGELIKTETIIFSNSEEAKVAIGLINKTVIDFVETGKTDYNELYSEIEEICSDQKFALGLDDKYPIDSYAANLIISEIKKKPLDENNIIDSIFVFKKAAVISAIKNGNIKNIFEVSDKLELDNSRIKDLYMLNFVDETFGTYTTGKLKNQTSNTIDEFYDSLYQQFVLSTVRSSNGYKNIQTVVDSFSNEIFGEVRNLTVNEAIKIQNKEYSSYKELYDAIASGSAGGKDSGSNGSGGGGVSGGNYSDGYINPTISDKMNKNIFDDIDNVSWAVESIVELAQMGIINGKSKWLFYPNDSITREEFVKMIVKAFFDKSSIDDINFTDVDDEMWYAEFVKKAYSAGIINGIGDNKFGVGMNITREEMAVIAYRTAIKLGKLTEAERSSGFSFVDDSQISDYAKTAVYALYDAEIIKGVSEEEFCAKDLLSRAQAAKIVYGIYDME